MKNPARSAALIVFPLALATFATGAVAQTDNSFANSATYVCRPALADESVSAKMVNNSMSLVCRPIAVELRMRDGSMKTIGNVTSRAVSAPNFSHALTPEQVNAAYNQWVERALGIDPATRHSP